MKIIIFLNNLGLGGTEKAAFRWAWGMKERVNQVTVLTLADGPRRIELEQHHVPARVVGISADKIAGVLREIQPDVIHATLHGGLVAA
ncbi:MAG: hypothetical protein ABSD57_01620 [Verrucomicrobiota bacterium]